MTCAYTNPRSLQRKFSNSMPKDCQVIHLLNIISNNENMRKGFTLIELLVVIAIIGLLASIVTVSLSSSQDRAKQAKIESFAAQVHHALAADAVGIWDFDDAAAGTANDTSGLKNNGTLPGGSNNPTSSTDRYENANRAYSFDGSGDYIRITGGILQNKTALTFSLWFVAQSQPIDYARLIDYGWTTDAFMFVYRASNALQFQTSDNGNLQAAATTSLIPDNKWHHAVAVWQSGVGQKLYLDGKIAGSASSNSFSPSLGTDILYMGGQSSSNSYVGSIDDVRIYKSALSSAQIQQLHAEGLPSHSLAQYNQ